MVGVRVGLRACVGPGAQFGSLKIGSVRGFGEGFQLGLSLRLGEEVELGLDHCWGEDLKDLGLGLSRGSHGGPHLKTTALVLHYECGCSCLSSQ